MHNFEFDGLSMLKGKQHHSVVHYFNNNKYFLLIEILYAESIITYKSSYFIVFKLVLY